MRELKRSTHNQGLRHLARVEAMAFVGLVWQGKITVKEAVETIGIRFDDRIRLEEFATLCGGDLEREIRRVIQLRDLALSQFQDLISSSTRQRRWVA